MIELNEERPKFIDAKEFLKLSPKEQKEFIKVLESPSPKGKKDKDGYILSN